MEKMIHLKENPVLRSCNKNRQIRQNKQLKPADYRPSDPSLSHNGLQRFLLLEAPVRECFLPFISFQDLAHLEMTSKSCHSAISSCQYWKAKVDEFLKGNPQAQKLFSRYSNTISTSSFNYHKRLAAKLVSDFQGVRRNMLLVKCKKAKVSYPWVGVEHMDGFALEPNYKYAFVVNNDTIQVLQVESTLRSTHLKVEKTFKSMVSSSIDADSTDHILAVYGQYLFHAHGGQIAVYDWFVGSQVLMSSLQLVNDQVTGEMVEITFMLLRNGRLALATHEPWSEGGGLDRRVYIWNFDEPRLKFVLEANISTTHESGLTNGHLFIRTLDFSTELVVIGFTDHREFGNSQVHFYNLKNKKIVREIEFQTKVGEVLLNQDQRIVLVGLGEGHTNQCMVQMIDVDTGSVKKSFRCLGYSLFCIWTDWKEYIFCGTGLGELFVWDYGKETMEASDEKEQVLQPLINLQGCNGLPRTDTICKVVFDGFHVVVYSQGDTKSTVRLLDFLNLQSIRF